MEFRFVQGKSVFLEVITNIIIYSFIVVELKHIELVLELEVHFKFNL